MIDENENENEIWWIDSATEPTLGAQVGGTVLTNVHALAQCLGRPCVIHNPSDHHMLTWATNYRSDTGLMERLCPDHGVGHPDPDDLAWHVSQGRDYLSVHGCCGCCRPPRQLT